MESTQTYGLTIVNLSCFLRQLLWVSPPVCVCVWAAFLGASHKPFYITHASSQT